MTPATRNARPPNATRRAHAAKQPSEYRDKLLAAGACLFVERGIARVSVEQIIAEAGVSRATFYGCFANKNELAAAILCPVFDSGHAALEKLRTRSPAQAAEALIDLYLHLWQNHRTALLLVGSFDGAVFPYIRRQHDAFNAALLQVLQIIESGGLLRTDNAALTLEVLAKTAIPLLQVYKDAEGFAELYRASLKGLILKVN